MTGPWFDAFMGEHRGDMPCAPPCECILMWWKAMYRLEQNLLMLGFDRETAASLAVGGAD